MISRLRVDYSLGDLFRTLRPANRGERQKERLRRLLRDYFGVDNVLLTPSGRAGLYSILRSSRRSRVIVPAFTSKAVVEAARLAGKEVEFVDVSRPDFNMASDAVRKIAGPDDIVVATHQFGFPCAIEEIVGICRARGALVIEDVAPAFGSRVNGRLVGTFGDAAFFSFDSRKAINVPLKGGFVITRDDDRFERIAAAYSAEVEAQPRSLTSRYWLSGLFHQLLESPLLYRLIHLLYFQMRGSFTAETAALDLRLSAFYRYDFAGWQAFVAAEQLSRIDLVVERRRILYRKLHEGLADCRAFELPPVDERGEWCCTRFPIRAFGDKFEYYRRASRRGIDFAFGFTFIAAPPDCEAAHRLASSVLNVPYYPQLRDREVERITRVLRSIDSDR